MGLWDKLTGEFIDVIAWTDDSRDTMAYRFERYGNEIKYGAKLTVRPGQVAVFVSEGKIADVFEPGMYTLKTENLPALSTLLNWQYGFQSPFKAEVYFFKTTQFTDLKWGTRNAVMLRDPEFVMVRLRAFGTYTMGIDNPVVLLQNIVGTDGHFTTDEIAGQLRNFIVSRFTEIIATSGISVLDLAANYDDLGKFIRKHLEEEFVKYGLKLESFLVENISLPDNVEAAIDKRTKMGIVGDLKKYMSYQAAQSLTDAKGNSLSSAGVAMGVGYSVAGQMAQTMAQTPPPIPQSPSEIFPLWIAFNGQKTGPFSQEKIEAEVSSGRLKNGTLVWHGGLSAWAKAKTVTELKTWLSQTPPALPKSELSDNG